MVTEIFKVVLEDICVISDTKVKSADKKMKGADLTWSNVANS